MKGSGGMWMGKVDEGVRKVWNRRWGIIKGTMATFPFVFIKSDHSDNSCSKTKQENSGAALSRMNLQKY